MLRLSLMVNQSVVVDDFSGRFKFYTDGFMEPSDCNDTLAENTITMFNLNDETLKKP